MLGPVGEIGCSQRASCIYPITIKSFKGAHALMDKICYRTVTNGVLCKIGHDFTTKVVMDRVSGRSKGFAFVTYATIEEAEQARKEMNAKFLDGWVIFVDPAKPREPRPPPQPEPQPSETGFRVNKTIGWCG
ncbi:RNA-binding (RRM/RBD/RNP motifs) family protein [Actinidia rufa]|uniref:RNA-binding (RRM/RBD/RNP motifs) family protein n=1 Tax=Actinidia rufa TaxID=165716 RepID=A0A7J0F3N3_9ERIC|nr:RNA-binding (RRM/RBD/RNP motifs) family protein [Actinidia rufa]